MAPVGMKPPSFERAAEQIKQQAREKQDQYQEAVSKTDKGIEQVQQKKNAIKAAIAKVKSAKAKLQVQAQKDPRVKSDPRYQKTMAAYNEKISEYENALTQCENQLEMLRGRKLQFRNALIKIAGQASAQLSMIRKRQTAQKQQQQTVQDQQKRKAAKAEGGKVRG